MKIHLLRHGMTHANEQKQYAGVTDLPLSERGMQDLLAYQKQGIYPARAEVLITSGMLRTRQTLHAIYGAVPSETRAEFAEYSFGAFEGFTHEELSGNPAYEAWVWDESGAVSCPGGESRNEFRARVCTEFARLQNYATEIMLVCHGGVIAYLMEDLFPDTRDFYAWQPKPGRGYTLMFAQGNKAKEFRQI